MIRFPTTELITERARALRVPLPVIVRDLARIVEILNLREQDFFAKDSVLAGGMALRAYGSHRLTIYDADLSTRAVTAPAQIRQLLTYTSPDIEIRPAPLVPTSDKTLGWCAHRLYKHLADLAFIAERLHDRLDPQLLRDLTDGKLDTMRKLQPAIYEDLRSLADVIAALERPGPITPRQQQGVRFLRNPYTPEQVIRIVRERYVPLLKP